MSSRIAPFLKLSLALGLIAGCQLEGTESDDGDPAGTGGSGGSGQSGSSNAGTGGTPTGGSGGSPSGGSAGTGTGGSVSNGGSAGSATGGSVASGGSSATGGSVSSGGAGAGVGGSSGGAAAGTGGSDTAGTGGSDTAGTGGSGGAAPTSGCGATTYPPSGDATMMVDGIARDYIVKIPDAYDPATPYRLVFAFHGRTGTADQIATGFGGGYYGLEQRIGDSTILVSPQGLGTDEDPADTGWPNTGGRDIAFVRAMIDSLSASYCVDSTRIFTTGMSYGGIMSNTIGCEMSDVFRGLASIAGAMFGRNGCDGPPIASWMTHGTADETVTYESGEAARDNLLAQNHCDETIQPVATEPEGCVEYQGCDAGFPVVWCTHDGGHTIPSYSGQAISDFFSQF